MVETLRLVLCFRGSWAGKLTAFCRKAFAGCCCSTSHSEVCIGIPKTFPGRSTGLIEFLILLIFFSPDVNLFWFNFGLQLSMQKVALRGRERVVLWEGEHAASTWKDLGSI